MTIEIKTSTLEPIRNTFENIERRFGDKPATRYQEATYDLQGEANYHYRPLWGPEHELNDTSRTALVMEDWYAFKDPRQFYYGTYVQQRSRMQENAESNFKFFDKRGLADLISGELKSAITLYLLPLRHVEHTANLNNMFGTAYGFGTAITQALLYNAMDRLGIAQYLSRIGLLMDGNTGETLKQAKDSWMHNPSWQGVRGLCEETLIEKDWFELLVAQNFIMDTLSYEIFYKSFDGFLVENGGRDIAMLTEFVHEWHKDTSRWMDAVMKTAAAESEENKVLLVDWVERWKNKSVDAFKPLAEEMVGSSALDDAVAVLEKRVLKAGIK